MPRNQNLVLAELFWLRQVLPGFFQDTHHISAAYLVPRSDCFLRGELAALCGFDNPVPFLFGGLTTRTAAPRTLCGLPINQCAWNEPWARCGLLQIARCLEFPEYLHNIIEPRALAGSPSPSVRCHDGPGM